MKEGLRFAEAEKFANLISVSNFAPKYLRGKPADCLAVLLQSLRWEMDPFAVAQKTYFVNDGMAYEAQLINAISISRAPINGSGPAAAPHSPADATVTTGATRAVVRVHATAGVNPARNQLQLSSFDSTGFVRYRPMMSGLALDFADRSISFLPECDAPDRNCMVRM